MIDVPVHINSLTDPLMEACGKRSCSPCGFSRSFGGSWVSNHKLNGKLIEARVGS